MSFPSGLTSARRQARTIPNRDASSRPTLWERLGMWLGCKFGFHCVDMDKWATSNRVLCAWCGKWIVTPIGNRRV